MPKIKSFCPVDRKTGSLLLPEKEILSDEDFEGFLMWLSNPRERALREKAYKALGGAASPESKADLIWRASGRYLRHMLDQSNQHANFALSLDATPEEQTACESIVSRRRSLLKSFHSIVAGEIFSAQMRQCRMSDKAIAEMASSFAEQDDLGASALKILAAGAEKASEVAEADAIRALRSWIEDPQRRAEIKKASDRALTQADRDALGEFAPLIEFIQTRVDPNIRAEMLARIEDYAVSGWLGADLIRNGDSSALAPWAPSHDGQARWRAMFDRVRSNPASVSSREFLDSFAERFCEIAVSVSIDSGSKAKRKGSEEEGCTVKSAHAMTPSEFFARAGSGMPDCLMISPGGSRAHITCASSDESLARQGNQMARYREAVERALDTGYLGDIPFPSGKPSIHCRTISVCLAQARGAKAGRQVGESFFSLFQNPKSPACSALAPAANALPFIALFETDIHRFSLEELPKYRFDLVGAKESVWEPIRAAAEASPTPAKTAFLGISELLRGFFEGSAKAGIREGAEISTNPGGSGRAAASVADSAYSAVSYLRSRLRRMEGDERAECERSLAALSGPFSEFFGQFRITSGNRENAIAGTSEALQALAESCSSAQKRKRKKP